MQPTLARTLFSSRVTLYPLIQVSPRVGRSRVARILIRVVFPAPLGPNKPKISPWHTSKETSFNASTERFSDLNNPLRARTSYVLLSFSVRTGLVICNTLQAGGDYTLQPFGQKKKGVKTY